MINPPEMPY